MGTTTDSAKAFKRLTPEEMAECRKLDLCYNCDEPFARGHKCARLFYLEAPDYIVEEPEEQDDAPPPAEETQFGPDKLMISLSAAMGIWARDTMQMRVKIGAHEFTALLDSGSTHNFINPDAASHADLQFSDSVGAHVIVANGDHVDCQGLARSVQLRIGTERLRWTASPSPWRHTTWSSASCG
jgi:hypothetical protein